MHVLHLFIYTMKYGVLFLILFHFVITYNVICVSITLFVGPIGDNFSERRSAPHLSFLKVENTILF